MKQQNKIFDLYLTVLACISMFLVIIYSKISDYTMNDVKPTILLWISFSFIVLVFIRLLFLRKSGVIFYSGIFITVIITCAFCTIFLNSYLPNFINANVSKDELYISAVHEAGHAIVYERLAPGSVIEAKVIDGLQLRIMRQFNLGTLAYVKGDLKLGSLPPLEKVKKQICVAYGGVAATDVFFPSDKYSGAGSDITKAYNLAKSIINEGMSSSGPLNFNMLSEHERTKIIQNLITPEYERAKQIILNNRELVKKLADELIKRKYLSGDEVRKIINNK